MFDVVALNLDAAEERLLDEGVRLDGLDGVLVQKNEFQTRWQRQGDQLADPVSACIQGLEVEPALEGVVVAQLLDLVLVDVQPLQVLGDESVVEPLKFVGGNVEPPQLGLSRQ